MGNNRKTLGIVIIILGILILALVIYLFLFNREEPVPEVENNVDTPIINQQLPGSENANPEPDTTLGDRPREASYDISQEESHETNETDLINMAKAFAERFGSYSNYSNYSNFSDLKIFMTSKMRTWADNYVNDLKASSEGSDEYFGVTTEAMSGKAVSYQEGSSAVVLVTTYRRENGDSVDEGRSYNQDIEITLENINGSWLVDSAYWQ
jgi:hypothetical protein